jgi:hypothetical protein
MPLKWIVKKNPQGKMDGVSDRKPQYKWPRYALAMVILFIVATIVWVTFEAMKVKQERNFSAPIESQ